jgi:hypothetical protein
LINAILFYFFFTKVLQALNPHFEHILLTTKLLFFLPPSQIQAPLISRKIPFDLFDGKTNEVHSIGERSAGSSLNEETNTDKYDGNVNF